MAGHGVEEPVHEQCPDGNGWAGDTAAHTHYNDAPAGSTPHDAGPGANSTTPFVGWHTYGAGWNTSSKKVTFYWDGSTTWSGSTATSTLSLTSTLARYLLFDNTISDQGLAPSAFPSAMQVDWVRVWK